MRLVLADSDYQLGSAAQTPGLNNSGTTVEYEVPTSQHITPLAEAYIARDRAYANQHVSLTEKLVFAHNFQKRHSTSLEIISD